MKRKLMPLLICAAVLLNLTLVGVLAAAEAISGTEDENLNGCNCEPVKGVHALYCMYWEASAYNAPEAKSENEALWNGTEYATLAEAVTAAQAADLAEMQTIQVLKNVAIISAFTVEKNIFIQGNGYTMTYGEGYASDIFKIEATGTLTVENLIIDGGFKGALDPQYLTPETYKYPSNRTDASAYPLTSTEGVMTTGDIFTNRGKLYVNQTRIQNFLSMAGSGWGDGLVLKIRADDTISEFDKVAVTNCINSGTGTLFNSNRGGVDGGDNTRFVMRNSSVTYTMGCEYGAVIHVRERSTFMTIENTVFDYNCINVDLDTSVLYIRDTTSNVPHSTAQLTDVRIFNSLGGDDVIEVYSGATLTLNETIPGAMFIESVGHHDDDDVYASGATINGGTITGSNSVSLGGNTYIGKGALIENPHITIGGTSTNDGTLYGNVYASADTGSLTNNGTIEGSLTGNNIIINSGSITGEVSINDGGYLENTGDGTVEGKVCGDVKVGNVIIDVNTANGDYLEMSGGVTVIPDDVTVTFTAVGGNGNQTTVTGPATIEDGYVILPPSTSIDGDVITRDHELRVPIYSIAEVVKDDNDELILPNGTIYRIHNTYVYGPVLFETDGSAIIINDNTETVVNGKVTVIGDGTVTVDGAVRASNYAEINNGYFTIHMTHGDDFAEIDNEGKTITVYDNLSEDPNVSRPTISAGGKTYEIIKGPVFVEDNQLVVPKGSTAMLRAGTSVEIEEEIYDGPAYIDAAGFIHFYVYLNPNNGENATLLGPYFTNENRNACLPTADEIVFEDRRFLGWFEGDVCDDNKDCKEIDAKHVYGQTMYLHAHWQESYTLTIQVTGCSELDVNQSFLFKLESEGVELYVTVVGNGSAKITNLPYGKYTVTQMNTWSWRYDPVSETFTLGQTIEEKGVTFDQKRIADYWLDGHAYYPGKEDEIA